MIALFIGRFQPLHKGHLAIIKRIEKSHQLKLGIGSAQYKNTTDNPLSINERRAMIERVLDEGIKAELYDIPDIHDDEKWVDHVRKIVGQFDVVYSGNELVIRLFREKNILVRVIKEIDPYKATKVREAIVAGKSVKKDVPAVVLSYLEEIGAIERIRKIKLSENIID